MNYRRYQQIDRRKSRQISVGQVPVGGDAPITVQTMTNTLTTDVAATVAQILRAERAGVDIVRVSCPDQESALALKHIVPQVNVPIVADIHFHYKRAHRGGRGGAACLRINPGNIGSPERVREVIKAARDHNCSMRIGVNAGCAGEASAGEIRRAEPRGAGGKRAGTRENPAGPRFPRVQDQREGVRRVHGGRRLQQLAEVCDHPLHIGITEAGSKRAGTVKSSIGLGSLLWAGIGDTMRVSLSAEPEEEVLVGWDMLKSLGIRHRGVRIISCPSCARQGFNVIKTVRDAGRAARAYRDADHALDHRLRGERAGRGADDRSRPDRRRRRPAHDLFRRQDRPHDRAARTWSSTSSNWWRPRPRAEGR